MQWRFRDYVLDLDQRELLRGESEVRISPKAFQLLQCLLENRPKAVSKEELHEKLWPQTFVSESNLPGLIRELRDALHDRESEHGLIRTIHRYGYSFAGEASSTEDAPVPSMVGAAPESFRLRRSVMALVGVGLLLALAGAVMLRPEPAVRPDMAARAVLPLKDYLAGGGTTFESDDDPELVGEALPFTLKMIENSLAESPRHRGLLLAATSGFTQYSYGWVHQPSDQIEQENLEAARAMRDRARRLYLRARDYGLRGLAVNDPSLSASLHRDPKAAVQHLNRKDVPLMYWTAASWGLAISLSKDNAAMVADLPVVEALIDRVVALDESFEGGVPHTFLITYELYRPGAPGDPKERARTHFDRAVELSGGLLASPFVMYAEQVSVANQSREEFESLLNRALAIDIHAKPQWRLANIIAQRRARWLLEHTDDLILSQTVDLQR